MNLASVGVLQGNGAVTGGFLAVVLPWILMQQLPVSLSYHCCTKHPCVVLVSTGL
jgi:hypothetical protein